MEFFQKASYCIITGASSGLGREIAVQFAREGGKTVGKSSLVLIARNVERLEETKRLIYAEAADVTVSILPADLSNLDTLSNVSSRIMESYNPRDHQQAVLVHCAGALGDITHPISQQQDPKPLTNDLTLHITSMWTLTAKFLSTVTSGPRFILNISSLLGTLAVGGTGLYGPTRAARDMFIKVLSVENPDVRTLTYTPGPCDTSMHRTLVENTCCESTRKMLKETKPLATAVSIAKLTHIIKEDKFDNASIIDYFD